MKAINTLAIAAVVMAATATAAHAQNDSACLSYDKPTTPTGTIVVRHVDFGKENPAWWSGSFPLMILDKSICAAGKDDPEEDLVWAVQLGDTCSRVRPATSRVRVTGELFHANTVHHHTAVVMSAKQVQRLDGKLPSCVRE
jgi:hypothetical protein